MCPLSGTPQSSKSYTGLTFIVPLFFFDQTMTLKRDQEIYLVTKSLSDTELYHSIVKRKTFSIFLCLFLSTESKLHPHYGKSYIFYEEKELHRTKRHIDLEPKRNSPRIEVSPIKHTERNKRSLYRPYVPGQGKQNL